MLKQEQKRALKSVDAIEGEKKKEAVGWLYDQTVYRRGGEGGLR